MLPDFERLPIDVYSVAQVRDMDRIAIEVAGIAGYTLMQRAGAAALHALRQRWPAARALRVYCGLGNNAGDGYVVARLAHGYGFDVSVIACAPIEQLSGDAGIAARDCVAAGVTPQPLSEQIAPQANAVVVDALFGTGLSRVLEGRFADAVAQMNAAGRPVIALDVPSGVDADTGHVAGPAVQAQCTIAFGGLKRGYFLSQAPDYCGQIEFSDLGMPDAVRAELQPVLRRLALQDIRAALPPRSPTVHKGDNGRLLVIGGGPGMPGAVTMAGTAALRAGAGLVYLATHPDHTGAITARVPELIVHRVESASALDKAGLDVDAIALGPGLGQSAWAAQLCAWAVAQQIPLIIDADGLNWLAQQGSLPPAGQPRILTPHPGEAARLLHRSVADVQRERVGAVTELASRFGATVVLKGARSLIHGPDNALVPDVCLAGNPGMASAGMGDILTGIAGGVLVQCRQPRTAVRAAVLMHALAGDTVAAASGQRGLMATDLLDKVRVWANPH
jgi:NAD(P)H-hydrate epimerase